MVCGCVWLNFCGVCWGGYHQAHLLCSYWICKPSDLGLIDPECCHLCAWDGRGYNCFFNGIICCTPSSIVEWSATRTAGRSALDVNSSKTVIINTNTARPTYVPTGI